MNVFVLLNTKEDILKNEGNRTVLIIVFFLLLWKSMVPQNSLKYLPLCSEQTHSYRFGTTWGWVNDDRSFIFEWTIPLSLKFHAYYSFCFQLLSKLCLFFSKLYTNPRIAHRKCKIPQISCKMKRCIQNITNTSQKQTFANTFAIILIPVSFCVLHREWCVYEIENWVKGR